MLKLVGWPNTRKPWTPTAIPNFEFHWSAFSTTSALRLSYYPLLRTPWLFQLKRSLCLPRQRQRQPLHPPFWAALLRRSPTCTRVSPTGSRPSTYRTPVQQRIFKKRLNVSAHHVALLGMEILIWTVLLRNASHQFHLRWRTSGPHKSLINGSGIPSDPFILIGIPECSAVLSLRHGFCQL